MADKQIMLDGVDVLKEKINMCFILLLNKLETSETIEQTIYEHLDVFVEEWNKQLKSKEQEVQQAMDNYVQLDLQRVKEYNELVDLYKAKKQEYENLKAELKNFQDMAKKGLDEFKDVGGCWGCGLQLQLNQDIQDIKQLKAENEKLKEENFTFEQLIKEYEKYGAIEKIVQQLNKLKSENKKLKKVECKFKNYCTCNTEKFLQTFTEIKEIAEADFNHTCWEPYARQLKQILQKINEVIK